MSEYKAEISQLEFDIARGKNQVMMLQEEVDRLNEWDWETANEEPVNEDEKEVDATIREMENVLNAGIGKAEDAGTAKSKPENADQATTQAAAPAATEPPSKEPASALPAETMTALTKVLEKTPKPVQMPPGPLPNSNTLPFWMSQLAANLSAAAVYSEYEEYFPN